LFLNVPLIRMFVPDYVLQSSLTQKKPKILWQID
jgi:hypothetical protein